MAKIPSERPFAPAGFFSFRTPLLPFDELEAFGEGLEAPAAAASADDPERLEAALAADRERLRARLTALAGRPEILEAIFLASPSLHESLALWRAQPDSKKGQRAERALVRYVYRMAARATPFGLFSGCSVGAVETAPGSPTRIAVGPRAGYERHTRLDMDYLFALCEDLGREPAVRAALTFRPNSSLYRAAARLRYAEARLDNKIRSHHLVAVDSNDYLEEALRRAEGGATAQEVAEALVAFDPDGDVSIDEAAEFVTELIDSQILVSDLSTPVTGPEAIHDLIDQLRRIPATADTLDRLVQVRAALEALDAGGPGADPARYEEVAATLRELPTSVEMSRLFQLDMVKPGDRPALGADVLEEIQRGVDVLLRLAAERPTEGVEKFRKEFNERYEGREVPLLQALDEEVGIGFERASDFGAEASPLLRGIGLGAAAAEQNVPWGRQQGFLLARVNRALANGERAIEITPEDLDKMAPPDAQKTKSPLPDAFHAMATLAATSQEAIDRGDFQLLFENAGGPSGARLLGRFCHADAGLAAQVEEHLRAEEAHRPDAVYAEVVHLPQGRIGNILARPVLREYEIPFLGRSGAPPERQIPVSDLRVSVEGSRIVLRSARLGKEVIPRLTSAHNFWRGSLGVYRFLCILQSQGVLGGVSWSWGPLESAPFLPRVTCGRLVLARAAWWMPEDEIKALSKAKGAERYRAVQDWRRKRGLPRLIALVDADNELLVDLDNVLSIETFLDVIEERDQARIVEFFPAPDLLAASGPEGRFLNEILVPFTRRPPVAERRERRRCHAEAHRRPWPPRPSRPRAAGAALLPARLRVALRQALHRHRHRRRPAARGGGAGGARRHGNRRGRRLVLHPLRRSGVAPARPLPRRSVTSSSPACSPPPRGARAAARRRPPLAGSARHLRAGGGALRRPGGDRPRRAPVRDRQRGRARHSRDARRGRGGRPPLAPRPARRRHAARRPPLRPRDPDAGDARHARGVRARVRRRQGAARAARPALPAGVAEPGAAARSHRRRGERSGAGAGGPAPALRAERAGRRRAAQRWRPRGASTSRSPSWRRASCTCTSTGSSARPSGRTRWCSTTSSTCSTSPRPPASARATARPRPRRRRGRRKEPRRASRPQRLRGGTSLSSSRSHAGSTGVAAASRASPTPPEPVRKPGSLRQSSSSPSPTTHIRYPPIPSSGWR